MPRVGIIGFLHESNTFLHTPTTAEHFRQTSWTQGQALLDRWSGAKHEIGGLIDGCREENLEPIPLTATFAVPSGALEPEAFDEIAAAIISSLEAALPLDGVLLALHGATVAKNFRDPDGEIASRVRKIVGPEIPVVMTLDLHANVSQKMVENTNATVIYRSNPHLDQRERGFEAARLTARTLRGEIKPVQALEMPPWVIPIACQHTAVQPAKGLYDDLVELNEWPGILSASCAMGFYYADVEEMGASFLAVADNDPALARRAARWLASRAWERRDEFITRLPSPEQAVGLAAESTRAPVALYDIGDNVGGGSPGDSTILFAEVLRQQAPEALVVLYDPECVEICRSQGVGAEVELKVGGKTDGRHGSPVSIRGRVRALTDGHFIEPEVRHGGWGINDQGLTAVVETAERHTVILTAKRMAPMSLHQVLSTGVRPESKRILIVKGVVAPRAAYDPVSAVTHLVDTSGATANNPAHFEYKHARQRLFPMDRSVEYSPK